MRMCPFCFYNAMKKYVMNIPKCTFKNVNLKFSRGEGREAGRIKEREDSRPFFQM